MPDAGLVDTPAPEPPGAGTEAGALTPARGRRSRASAWIGAAVSVVSLAGLAWWISRQGAPRLPTDAAHLGALAAAVALYLVNTGLRAERWQRLLERSGVHPARRETSSLTAVGFMGNNVLPARAGDALRVLLLRAPGPPPRRTVIGTLVAERLLDLVVLLALFAVLAVGFAHDAPLPSLRGHGPLLLGLGVALAAGAGLAATLARRGPGRRLLAWLRPILAAALTVRGSFGAAMLAASAAIWGVEAGVCWITAQAAGLHMTGLDALYLIAVAAVFQLIPSGPAYAGTQDAAIVLAVRGMGASAPSAVAYLLLLRFVLVVPVTLLGLALAALRYGGLRRMRGVLARRPAPVPAPPPPEG